MTLFRSFRDVDLFLIGLILGMAISAAICIVTVWVASRLN